MMKQYDYRTPNKRCLACSTPRPKQVEAETGLDFTRFTCEKCGTTILRRLTTNDDVARFPEDEPVPHVIRSFVNGSIPPDASLHVDIYWTPSARSLVINGRHAQGNENLTEFAKHIESL